MRESCTSGSVRGAHGETRVPTATHFFGKPTPGHRRLVGGRFGSLVSKAAEAVRPCTSATPPKSGRKLAALASAA